MEFENTEKVLSIPTVIRMRTGMFSAQDGLFLAVFMAVIVVVAYIVKVVCNRCCGVKCDQCKHKQDPAHATPGAASVPAIIVDKRHSSGSSVHGGGEDMQALHHEHPAASVTAATSHDEEDEMSVFEDLSSGTSYPAAENTADSPCSLLAEDLCNSNSSSNRREDAGRRESHPMLMCSMQTVYEEEENDDLQAVPLRSPLENTSTVQEVFTIYHFPQTDSSPIFSRTVSPAATSITTTTTATNTLISGDRAMCCSVRHVDHPPSYDDLFPPSPERSTLRSARRNRASLSNSSPDIQIRIEPETER